MPGAGGGNERGGRGRDCLLIAPALLHILGLRACRPRTFPARGGPADRVRRARVPAGRRAPDLRAALRRRAVAPVPDLALPPRRLPAVEQPVVRGPLRVRELQRPLLPAGGADRRAARTRGRGGDAGRVLRRAVTAGVGAGGARPG